MGGLALVTAPEAEPVTLAEAKAHLRLETDDDDTVLTNLIKAARIQVEALCWRALVNQTWDMFLDEFPVVDELELDKGTLQSVTSITYIDQAEAEQTLPSSSYHVVTSSVPGMVVLKSTASWPAVGDVPNPVTIRFVAGYGAAPEEVPEPIRQAVLMLVAHLYENRNPVVTGTTAVELPSAIWQLLGPFRLVRF